MYVCMNVCMHACMYACKKIIYVYVRMDSRALVSKPPKPHKKKILRLIPTLTYYFDIL